MQIISKNSRWRAIMGIYKTTKFNQSSNNLSWDIVLTERCPEQKEKKTEYENQKPMQI